MNTTRKYTHILSMNDVGLGSLNEVDLLTLFANYHSLALVEDCSNKPNEIVDKNGRILYPAYFMTHLMIPIEKFIEAYALWDKIEIEIDIKRFGANILDSKYTLEDGTNQSMHRIEMVSNSMFVVDMPCDINKDKISSTPLSDHISNLDRIQNIPSSIKKFKYLRESNIKAMYRYSYMHQVISKRDISQGHNMIFSKFTEIMNICDYIFLFDILKLPRLLSTYIHLLDREVYYYGNCYENDILECDMRLDFIKCDNPHLIKENNMNTPYYIKEYFEIKKKGDNELLILAITKKFICLPNRYSDIILDINRIVKRKEEII